MALRGWEGVRTSRSSTGHSQGSETILCDMTVADTRHDASVQSQRTQDTESEP